MVERGKFFILGLVMPVIFGIMRYLVNQGDYHKNEFFIMILYSLCLWFSIVYLKRTQTVQFEYLRQGQVYQLLLFLLISTIFHYTYPSLFDVASSSSDIFAEKRLSGYSLSLVLAIGLFGPIEEEVFMRGFIQRGAFQNSWLGLVVTSCLFSLLHVPSDIVSFGYYALAGMIYGATYKYSGNLLTPIICHICHNSLVLIFSII